MNKTNKLINNCKKLINSTKNIGKSNIVKEISNAIANLTNKSAMPQYVIDEIKNGGLPVINVDILNLLENEFCCYVDYATTYKDVTKVVGYSGNNAGFSIRIAKGLSYRSGASGGNVIRNTERTTYNGFLLLTNKRIIFTSKGISFDKPISKLSSIIATKNELIFQFGQKTYEIQVASANVFKCALNTLKNNPNCKIDDTINS